MTEANPSPLLTLKEAARYLGVHRNTLQRIARKGLIPYYTVNDRGDIRFRMDDVDAWLAGRRKEGTDGTG